MKEKREKDTVATAAALFGLFLSIYMLTYAGIYHVFDEEYYGLRTRSFVNNPTKVFLPLLHSHSLLRLLRLSHRLPFIATLSIFFKASQTFHGFGAVQTMYLTNILAGALTVTFIFLSGMELGYGKRLSLLVAGIYGLATPAWVYTKTLLREPFAWMLLIGGIYFLIKARKRKSILSFLCSTVLLLLAVSTRISTAAVLPFAGLYLLVILVEYGRTHLKREKPVYQKTIFGFFLISLLLLAIEGYFIANHIEHIYMHYLQTPTFFFHYGKTQRKALIGLLISPGRGLFVYTPPLILSLIGAYSFAKRHPAEFMLLYLPTIGYIAAIAHYTVWWGGWSWMSRYLIPFLPLMAFPMISLIEKITSKVWCWAALISLTAAGLLIQVLGVTIGRNYLAVNTPMDSSGAFSWKFAPFVWQFMNPGRHVTLSDVDIALVNLTNIFVSLTLSIGYIATIAVFGFILHKLSRESFSGRRKIALFIGAIIFISVLIPATLSQFYVKDKRYKAANGYLAAIEYIKAQSKPEDGLAVDCYLSDELNTSSRLMNFCKGNCPEYRIVAREVWQRKNESFKSKWIGSWLLSKTRVWLIPTDLPPGSPTSRVEQWMDAHYFKQGCKWTGKTIRVCLYFLPSPEYRDKVLMRNISFGDQVKLQQIILSTKSGEPNNTETIISNPGAPLLITFRWRLIKHVSKNYKFTLQLLGPDGKLYAQKDETIGELFKPISTWRLDEVETERYALVLPTRMKKDVYTLLLGVYAPQSGDRLIPKGPSNIFTLDHLVKISTVTINTSGDLETSK